ncbi:MAG: dTDP-4-dehydrorhamnose 3,5-epimerase [Alicyclobacillus macrosporangiidus]|uniref:dTDP-4-dehydrorhamnose 3,5-epimerase n=1 Tax=Alicyclobacillus macrosporangiidus TaxID=392015 RepID=UPI0026ECF419|nr:dTDP-4-dehydrorhamnose 3,5-epimerase [Alicyclobacillus macrosporangiidus]MCL6598830.1 dTDP-4-dehydrorhamnose 3,5-epimerase [Alicyclobacillus macrosporangiidus]
MKIIQTELEGVVVIEPDVFGDHRGYFTESYHRARMAEAGFDFDFVQDNQSFSVQAGTIRGLHYQLHPKAQTKLVRVIQGAVYDVAVDIRRTSPTFGKWVGVILSADNHRQLLVPKGFAHGFCTLVPNTIVAYKVDEYYSPEYDRGIYWGDERLGIPWPTSKPVLSDKDARHPRLHEADLFE